MAHSRVEGWSEAQMPDSQAKLAEQYGKLATEEVAMAKLALTNEARARHYAKATEISLARCSARSVPSKLQTKRVRSRRLPSCSTFHPARAPEQDRGHKDRQQARRLTKQGAAQGNRCPLPGSGPPPKRYARRFWAGANRVPIALGMGGSIATG